MILLRETGVHLAMLARCSGITPARSSCSTTTRAVILGLVYGVAAVHDRAAGQCAGEPGARVVEAGYDLGGSRWTVLRRIVIPHAMPGIVAGWIIVFMLTVGNFATPVLLGGKNGLWFTEQIYTQFITRFNWPQGAAFGMLLLLLSSAIVWLGPAAHRPEPRHHLRQA